MDVWENIRSLVLLPGLSGLVAGAGTTAFALVGPDGVLKGSSPWGAWDGSTHSCRVDGFTHAMSSSGCVALLGAAVGSGVAGLDRLFGIGENVSGAQDFQRGLCVYRSGTSWVLYNGEGGLVSGAVNIAVSNSVWTAQPFIANYRAASSRFKIASSSGTHATAAISGFATGIDTWRIGNSSELVRQTPGTFYYGLLAEQISDTDSDLASAALEALRADWD